MSVSAPPVLVLVSCMPQGLFYFIFKGAGSGCRVVRKVCVYRSVGLEEEQGEMTDGMDARHR